MIIVNEEKLKRLQELSQKDIYILTDFDGTLTLENDYGSSWASIFKSGKVSEDFIKECQRIYNFYHKYEIDNNLSNKEKSKFMDMWYQENINTLKKFKITKDIINSAIYSDYIIFRNGVKNFLKRCYEIDIPIIIISAGVGNIIKNFLIKENTYYSNIYICSNFLTYNDDIVSGVKDNNLIHPLNKDSFILNKDLYNKIKNRKNALLLGNNIMDLKMSKSKNVFKIGFARDNIDDFKDKFDIICFDDSSYDEIMKKLELF